MSGFYCKNCDFDLSLKVDLLARTVKSEYSEEDPPEDLCMDGICENCGEVYSFEGAMFTHFVISKANEDIISPEVNDMEIVEFEVSEEDAEEFKELMDKGDQEKLQAFIYRLMRNSKK